MYDFKTIWIGRNPQHEINLDTGEDMFFETAQMCADEYADQKLKAIRKKITDRMYMFPDVDDPSLRDRGAIDAYTNALEWIDELNK